MTLPYSLAEAVLAEPKNFIFFNKNIILYPALWRTALSWSRKRLHPPGNFRNISKSHHSFLFRTGTEAKGLEGETAVGHPTSDGDVRNNTFEAFKPEVSARSPCSSRTWAPPAPFCRGSPPARPRQRHTIPLWCRPPEPRFSSSSCSVSHRSLFRTVVRS